MTDQEKPKEIIEERHYFDSSDPDKGSDSASKSGFKDKIVGKITSTTLNKAGENNVSLPEAVRISNNIRTILMGLFILIGFIVLVFAIFVMVALIAAIIGAFALFGVVVYQIRGENKAQH